MFVFTPVLINNSVHVHRKFYYLFCDLSVYVFLSVVVISRIAAVEVFLQCPLQTEHVTLLLNGCTDLERVVQKVRYC